MPFTHDTIGTFKLYHFLLSSGQVLWVFVIQILMFYWSTVYNKICISYFVYSSWFKMSEYSMLLIKPSTSCSGGCRGYGSDVWKIISNAYNFLKKYMANKNEADCISLNARTWQPKHIVQSNWLSHIYAEMQTRGKKRVLRRYVCRQEI